MHQRSGLAEGLRIRRIPGGWDVDGSGKPPAGPERAPRPACGRSGG